MDDAALHVELEPATLDGEEPLAESERRFLDFLVDHMLDDLVEGWREAA